MTTPTTNRVEASPIEISSTSVPTPAVTVINANATLSSNQSTPSPAEASLQLLKSRDQEAQNAPSRLFSRRLGRLRLHGIREHTVDGCIRGLTIMKTAAATTFTRSTATGNVSRPTREGYQQIGRDPEEGTAGPIVGLRGGAGEDDEITLAPDPEPLADPEEDVSRAVSSGEISANPEAQESDQSLLQVLYGQEAPEAQPEAQPTATQEQQAQGSTAPHAPAQAAADNQTNKDPRFGVVTQSKLWKDLKSTCRCFCCFHWCYPRSTNNRQNPGGDATDPAHRARPQDDGNGPAGAGQPPIPLPYLPFVGGSFGPDRNLCRTSDGHASFAPAFPMMGGLPLTAFSSASNAPVQPDRPATIAVDLAANKGGFGVNKSHSPATKTTAPGLRCGDVHRDLCELLVKPHTDASNATADPSLPPESRKTATTKSSAGSSNGNTPSQGPVAENTKYDTVFQAVIRSRRPHASQPRRINNSSEEYRKETLAWMSKDANVSWIFKSNDEPKTNTSSSSQQANPKLHKVDHVQPDATQSSS